MKKIITIFLLSLFLVSTVSAFTISNKESYTIKCENSQTTFKLVEEDYTNKIIHIELTGENFNHIVNQIPSQIMNLNRITFQVTEYYYVNRPPIFILEGESSPYIFAEITAECNQENEVPEFGLLGLGIIILAGLFIIKRKK